MLSADWHTNAWRHLENAVRTGNSAFYAATGSELFQWFETHPAEAATFNAGMTAGRSYREAGVPEALELSGHERVVDVGGGRGSLLRAILERYPQATGILADTPQVLQEARTFLASATVFERLEFRATNFFEAVPNGADVYVLSHILHDWSDADCLRILETCRCAMPSDGRLVLVENLLPEDNTASRVHWLDLEMLVLTRGGKERMLGEFRALLTQSGFTFLRATPTPGGRYVLHAVVSRLENTTGPVQGA
jgi:ubiquinone/menaquinone biosynthesis C-methylase UbiE